MTKFGELLREEKLALFEAWLDGKEIEHMSTLQGDTFSKISSPCWISDNYYRIAKTKPSVNWDHVSDKYNWLAVDSSGDAYLYESKHKADTNMFLGSVAVTPCQASVLISYKRGTCNWEESLIQRPSKVS